MANTFTPQELVGYAESYPLCVALNTLAAAEAPHIFSLLYKHRSKWTSPIYLTSAVAFALGLAAIADYWFLLDYSTYPATSKPSWIKYLTAYIFTWFFLPGMQICLNLIGFWRSYTLFRHEPLISITAAVICFVSVSMHIVNGVMNGVYYASTDIPKPFDFNVNMTFVIVWGLTCNLFHVVAQIFYTVLFGVALAKGFNIDKYGVRGLIFGRDGFRLLISTILGLLYFVFLGVSNVVSPLTATPEDRGFIARLSAYMIMYWNMYQLFTIVNMSYTSTEKILNKFSMAKSQLQAVTSGFLKSGPPLNINNGPLTGTRGFEF